jgi:plastocyanin
MRMPLALAAVLLALPALAAAETHTVTIDGMKFQPAAVTVKRGDKVVWRNKDVVPHTATSAGKFDSGQIANGASWSWTAAAPGHFEYVCTYHPGMKAVVDVK